MSQLSSKLRESKPYENNHRVALYGLGGVGKTQTALAYVYLNQDSYESIFWISGVNQATLLSDFGRIAGRTMCHASATPSPTECAEKVIEWLDAQASWLLVIDNLDDIKVINGFLPTNNDKKHTLITTRNRHSEGIPAQGQEVPPLNLRGASDLFLIMAKLPFDCEQSRLEANNIVTELGYLPLAIEQAAAFVRETERDIHDFLPLYCKSRSDRIKLHKWIPEGNRRYKYSVSTTWEISFSHIKNNEECPVAVKLLQLFAFLNPDVILIEFLRDALDAELRDLIRDEIKMDETLKVLQRFSLIKRIPKALSISIHRLVQEVIQYEFGEEQLSAQ